MMHENEDNDDLFRRSFSSLEASAAPIDSNVIDDVCATAGDVFEGTVSSQAVTTAKVQAKKGRSMIAKAVIGISAMAAALMLLFQPPASNEGDMRLGTVLDKTLEAQTLKLAVDRDAGKVDVVVKNASLVRWQESPQKYRISDGTRIWSIDEGANLVQAADSPWHHGESHQVDLLSLLGLDEQQSKELRESLSTAETVTGKPQTRYVFTSTTGKAAVHAFWDTANDCLSELRCWPQGYDPQVQPIKLLVLARDIQVDESQFVVATRLSADGRIGKVVDSEGIVSLRPMMNQRWTPVARQMLLKPGDWLRTDARGANASTLVTTGQFKVTVGPASLLELRSPTELRLHRGELKVTGSKRADEDLRLLGPAETFVSISKGKSAHYRIDRAGDLAKVDKKPVWLEGFEGLSTVDSVGSLITNIDGRETRLSVGFHHVKVEIRDQIARTTIEESFVNHTSRRLEGIFHFPLPQDASISGFGMWIGNELVEADVVEKQRAREIYETILREKRDPGLLEWTGGNIFKARVFPIEPSSEKRIKIVYTQVLPMRANQYRYSYGLRSEMLQTTPLRDLTIDVQVHSELPLRSAKCISHPVRAQQTEHAAKLEFDAQEYTPSEDFELVCEVDASGKDVVVVPHQRGDDGYFMVQLTPPDDEGVLTRELVTDGEPLQVLIVCDTSASIDSNQRKQQQRFVLAVLSALGEDDRFDIAHCDVTCQWLHDEVVPPTDHHVDQAIKWLGKRISLGWTNLDRMVESILDRAGSQTHVIYVGDGIVTAGDPDPTAFVNRLRRLTENKQAGKLHTVSVGSSYESVVLRALAAVGGGSYRQVDADRTPQRVASELLQEISQPPIRDLQVEFHGLQVAAVYPEKLPNLAAGTQQILIGRYLPQGQDQRGEIVVTGSLGDRSVRMSAPVTLADAESGNSFIPRLWARAHLDHLLAQGTSEMIRDQIIALSEEFHIITPYTSLLVLETDADRERFGVKRRFQMRDGERFFAEGRSQSDLALLQQQMKRAGDWRLALRRRILLEMTTLGRDPQIFAQMPYDLNVPMSGPAGGPFVTSVVPHMGLGGNWVPARGGGVFKAMEPVSELSLRLDATSINDSDAAWDLAGSGGNGVDFQLGDFESGLPSLDNLEDMQIAGERRQSPQDFRGLMIDGQVMQANDMAVSMSRRSRSRSSMDGTKRNRKLISGKPEATARIYSGYDPYGNDDQYTAWLDQLFPIVPAAPQEFDNKKPTGSEEALSLLESLIQQVELGEENGIEVTRENEIFDPLWKRNAGQSQTTELSANDRWLKFTDSIGSETHVHWCDQEQRGVFSRAFQMGRTRGSTPTDLSSFDPGERPLATAAQLTAHAFYEAAREDAGQDRATVVLIHPNDPRQRKRVTIDNKRNIVTSIETWNDWIDESSKPSSTRQYSDHKQVAGVWWPGRIESLNQSGERVSETRQNVRLLGPDRFAKRFDKDLPNRDKVLLLSPPIPTVRQAHIAVRDGTADARHRLTLILDASLVQDWDAALRHLQGLETVAAGKPCLPWMRAAVLKAARKNNDMLEALRGLADNIAANQLENELYASEYLIDQVRSVGDHNESLRIVNRLSDVFQRQPPHADGNWRLKKRRAEFRRALGDPQAIDLQREIAAAAPWDFTAQIVYAQDLIGEGEYDAAIQWLEKQLSDYPGDTQTPLESLRDKIAQILRQTGRRDQLVKFMKSWVDAQPNSHNAYRQYLAALEMDERTEDADALARQWLKDAQIEGQLEPPIRVRLDVAIEYALGQRYQTYMNWIDPNWRQPLAETATYFLESEQHADVAQRILSQHQFTDSDESDLIHAQMTTRLKESAGTLDVKLVQSFVSRLVNRDELSQADWTSISEALLKRWNAEQDRQLRNQLGAVIVSIYGTHFANTECLPFLRARIQRAEADKEFGDAASFRRQLLDELVSRDWQQAYEDQAAALISDLGAQDDQTSRLPKQLRGLFEFVDRMLAARQAADRQKLRDTGHPEKLTRTEYAEQLAELLDSARSGLAETLAQYADQDTELGRWFQLEQMHLNVKLGRQLKQIANHCWKTLGDSPKTETVDFQKLTIREAVELQSSVLRRDRAYAILSYLAVRRSAPKKLVDRLQAYVQAGTELEDEEGWRWRDRQYDLLIALDQPNELHQRLTEWIREDAFPVRWQRSLARLEAERGQIQEAIALMESVSRLVRLEAEDHAALADWYLVSDQRDKYRQAKVAAYQAMPEHHVSNWIQQRQQRWFDTNVPLPSELDENVLYAFRALFAKSNQPENYIYHLQRFYEASRDFRLLQMLPDSVLGRTPQQIYSLLQRVSSQLLSTIRREATTDEIVTRINELREQVESPLDLRALDLLETMIERQAAKVLNQPGPHIDRAVAAMKRAFKHEWADGEITQMAEFLTSLDTLSLAELREERLRQFRQLRELTEPDSEQRFFVTWHMAHSIFWSHGDHDQALPVMESAIAGYRKIHPEGLPLRSNQAVFDYVRMLGYKGRFAEAEQFLTDEINKPLNEAQRLAYVSQRNNTYIQALRDRGQVSLGSGDTLYENLRDHLLEQVEAADGDNGRSAGVDALLKFYRTASEKSFADAKDDLWTFATRHLPGVLDRQTNNYQNIVDNTSDMIVRLLGKLKALDFMVQRIEDYPPRLTYSWNNPWRQFGYEMAQWRKEHENQLGDLEPRLLAVVIKELRRDLTTRHSHSRYIYGRHGNTFWDQKADVFADVAEQVHDQWPDSGRSVAYVAGYLANGLHRYDRAIEMLLAVHEKNPLKWQQLNQLVRYLHVRERFAEAIPILEPLVQSRPDDMHHRVDLLKSYHRSGRKRKWNQLLLETDTHFRQGGRWTESNVSQLANCCLENKFFAEAATYYGELIPMCKRGEHGRRNDFYTLAHYYAQQADAFTGLGQTAKAVDSASAAIMTYHRYPNDRRGMVYKLRQVLDAAKDLDEFVQQHDQITDATGQDNPLLRKQLGLVFASRGQHERAIKQLRAAIALQPTDTETHTELIKVLDAKGDSDDATRQLLALLDIDRHNLKAYQQLADRLKDDPGMSERAITTIVEAAPNEAEHHQAVAEIRQQQDRWSAAIDHWKQVTRLRRSEPNGLLKLAEAQIHARRIDDARITLRTLSSTEWPSRFSDVQNQIEKLTTQLSRSGGRSSR